MFTRTAPCVSVSRRNRLGVFGVKLKGTHVHVHICMRAHKVLLYPHVHVCACGDVNGSISMHKLHMCIHVRNVHMHMCMYMYVKYACSKRRFRRA